MTLGQGPFPPLSCEPDWCLPIIGHLAPLLLSVVLDILAIATRPEEIKGIQFVKKVKLSVADNMVLNIEKPKYSTKKLLKLINEFNKVGCRIITKNISCIFIHQQ